LPRSSSVTDRYVKSVWNIGGMTLTGENGSTGIKSRPNVILSTAKTGLGSDPGLRGETPMANRLRLLILARSTCVFKKKNKVRAG
jgi:hypothetical protein